MGHSAARQWVELIGGVRWYRWRTVDRRKSYQFLIEDEGRAAVPYQPRGPAGLRVPDGAAGGPVVGQRQHVPGHQPLLAPGARRRASAHPARARTGAGHHPARDTNRSRQPRPAAARPRHRQCSRGQVHQERRLRLAGENDRPRRPGPAVLDHPESNTGRPQDRRHLLGGLPGRRQRDRCHPPGHLSGERQRRFRLVLPRPV